jgi:hypothetical protein
MQEDIPLRANFMVSTTLIATLGFVMLRCVLVGPANLFMFTGIVLFFCSSYSKRNGTASRENHR